MISHLTGWYPSRRISTDQNNSSFPIMTFSKSNCSRISNAIPCEPVISFLLSIIFLPVKYHARDLSNCHHLRCNNSNIARNKKFSHQSY
jgi:hypothetical protein